MYKYVIVESQTGYEVYVNLIGSSAGQYLNRQPYVIKLLKEVLLAAKLNNSTVVLEHDMGRVIGNTDILETTDKDTIFYAQPVKKNVFSRYAKNRYPIPSRKLTIRLQQDANGDYEILDTWIGPSSPPFPGDKDETANSKTYWETHALAQDAHSVQSRTITKICPY